MFRAIALTLRARLRFAEALKKLASSAIPLLASPQGGEGCVIKKISRSDRSRRSRGGFPNAAAVLDSSENHPGLAVNGSFATFC